MNISCVAYMFDIKPRTLHYWYKNYLSGYEQQRTEGSWGDKHIDVVDEETGEVVSEKTVPIAKVDNMGASMTIDEKQIGKRMYTVMTNQKSGKIALVAESLKPAELKRTLEDYLADKLEEVHSVSCDMSSSYIKLIKDVFPEAMVVIDKFHVITHLMDALRQVRGQLKTQILNETKLRAAQPTDPSPTAVDLPWTDMEMVERSRYILCKGDWQWDEDETRQMNYLFNKFPVLETAYRLTQKLRRWYDKRYVGSDLDLRERDLYDWCDDVNQSRIPAFRGVKKLIERNHDDIINYFKEGHTNARAENMNGKIQRFIANNFGIRNRDFFMFRLAGYFS